MSKFQDQDLMGALIFWHQMENMVLVDSASVCR